MKILIYSTAFAPSIGGLETIAKITADGLSALGHEVIVCCKTAAKGISSFENYEVIRFPTLKRLWVETREADVFLMLNMNLKILHVPLLARTPLVIGHHGWYGENYGDKSLRIWLKRRLSRLTATNIACSSAVATYIGGGVHVIPNAYDSTSFFSMPGIDRKKDILFVGRLVSTKGVPLLLAALADLHQGGHHSELTITGDGPEKQALMRLVEELGLKGRVQFTGTLCGKELALVMNSHKVLAVPSVPAEPFGVVALEGAACGCVVVGSERGGLKEAIGPCGFTFPNGDKKRLAETMLQSLRQAAGGGVPLRDRERHLGRHQVDQMVRDYEQVLASVAVSRRPRH